MCGVIGLIHKTMRPDLGVIASDLLRTLEYRGYDSTGAAFQGDDETITLLKDVGAPSVLTKSLGIDKMGGRVLCAQVRWATFGAVDALNAQPHVVRCKTSLYGAHNGNVTNCDALKHWLLDEGHRVVSDNDGEMVVHTVEHFFAEKLKRARGHAVSLEERRAFMREAITLAGRKIRGSYAAVVVDPVTQTVWAIKAGSSLYFGLDDESQNPFRIASSDLSAVLRLTRTLVSLSENEVIEFSATHHALFHLDSGAPIVRHPVQSRLRAEDTELRPEFSTFMEQEIHAQVETTRFALDAFFPAHRRPLDPDSDVLAEDDVTRAFQDAVRIFCDKAKETIERRGRIVFLACGSSFHAAKTAALFFHDIAGTDILPLLPGEFRGQLQGNLRDGDTLVAVSQSGETKDLVDALNDVIRSGRDVFRVALVNNVNSTLAQEKANLVIPLRCGPEIAVAATKSYLNQLAVLYGLAVELGLRTSKESVAKARKNSLFMVSGLVAETLRTTEAAVLSAAEHLYLRPSIHILATRLIGVAKEGALKIREVVLNHTEGFEASEFKHGPNTILGFNTVFGIDQIERILAKVRAQDAKDEKHPALSELLKDTGVDYPLVYVTGPDTRDVDLTISQINTHKIRGASTVVIAEESAVLRAAAEKAPADNPNYKAIYIPLPETGDALLTAFTATVVLQRLALTMSLKKRAHLDALGIPNHGVLPDVPKNVSKSITVD